MPSRSLFATMLVAFFAVTSALTASAQVAADREVRVQFPAGATGTTLRDEVLGQERLVYRLSIRKGQTVEIRLTSNTRLAEFLLYAPGTWPNGRPLATSSILGALVPELNRYVGRASADGDFRVVVRNQRDVAATGLQSRFRLELSATGGVAGGGVATQLPDAIPVPDQTGYWRVSGLASGDKLNVRTGPGTSYRVVDQLAQGEVVKNEGCTGSGSARWCEVSRPSRPREIGWVSARFLVATSAPRPGSGQGATQLPGDALVGETVFNATGRLLCVIANRARQCDFGVVRRGRGNATLYVDLPSGIQRRIEFTGGRAVSSNAQGSVFAEFTGAGSSIVYVGASEEFTVNDAILFGG